jgi:hypothetical protein
MAPSKYSPSYKTFGEVHKMAPQGSSILIISHIFIHDDEFNINQEGAVSDIPYIPRFMKIGRSMFVMLILYTNRTNKAKVKSSLGLIKDETISSYCDVEV